MQLGGLGLGLSNVANQAIAGGNTYEGKEYVDAAAGLANFIPGAGPLIGAGINLASGAIARFGGTNPEEEHLKKIRELVYQGTRNKSDAILAENFEGRKSGLPTTKGVTRTYEFGGIMAQADNRRNMGMSVVPSRRYGGLIKRKRMMRNGGKMKGRKKMGMKRMKMMYKMGGMMKKKKAGSIEMTMKMKKKKYRGGGSMGSKSMMRKAGMPY